jgi:hypothetical protein
VHAVQPAGADDACVTAFSKKQLHDVAGTKDENLPPSLSSCTFMAHWGTSPKEAMVVM